MCKTIWKCFKETPKELRNILNTRILSMQLKNYKNNTIGLITNQRMNGYLKEIADLCKIKKNLTFHLARHTFATTVTLSNGVPIESVSKMLGHTSIRTTQIRSEEHTSELQSRPHLVCRLLLEKKKPNKTQTTTWT